MPSWLLKGLQIGCQKSRVVAKIPSGHPVCVPGFLDCWGTQLAVQTKRVAAQVDGGAQVQQVLNIECLRDFLTPPLLSVRFR